MRIKPDIIEQIRAQSDLVAYIGKYVELKKRGKNWFGLSPFKTEKTASFSVNESGFFHCFATGESGDIFTFAMHQHGYNFHEAAEHLALDLGIDLKTTADPAAEHRSALRIIANEVNKIYQNQLPATAEYLTSRGFSDDTQLFFELGYASGQETLPEAAADIGLIVNKPNGNYPLFFSRVIFPIKDTFGRLVGFGGRRIDGKKEYKYINSPASPIYDKSAVLYGLFQNKAEIRSAGIALLTEGYTDVISLWQSGIRTAVASCGTALSNKQARELFRFTRHVQILRDSDSAGIKATKRDIATLLAVGIEPSVGTIPNGQDPDSYIKENGREAFLENVNNTHWLDYIHHFYAADFDDPAKWANWLEEIGGWISAIPFELQRLAYSKKIQNEFGIPLSTANELCGISTEEIEEIPASPYVPGRNSWGDYEHLSGMIGTTCPDFSEQSGNIIIQYHDLKGHPAKNTAGGNLSRDLTRSQKIEGVYIPANFRAYYENRSTSNKPQEPLFLVPDEISAWLLDTKGIFAIGLPHRTAFLERKNGKKIHQLLRPVLALGFTNIVYLPAGDIFQLPPKAKDYYKTTDASLFAQDYEKALPQLKAAFEKQNVFLVHLQHKLSEINSRSTDWLQELLVSNIENLSIPCLLSACYKGADSQYFTSHNISDNNLRYYQKILHSSSPQSFFDFHGIEQLRDLFQYGKYLYEVDRNNQVAIKEEAKEHAVIFEDGGTYWARRRGGSVRISDFKIDPMLKIRGAQPHVLCQIIDKYRRIYDLVLDSKLLLNADQFHLRIYGLTDCFFHGTNIELRHLQEMVFKRMPQAYMVDQLGHIKAGPSSNKIEFFAFGNGIVDYESGRFIPIDGKGLIEYQGETLFLPADSEFELAEDRDMIYETHQKFSYDPGQASFEDWIKLMFEVHQPMQAHTGFAYVLIALYRDIIFKEIGKIPNLYFQGETGSGKSTCRESLSALFGQVPTIFINGNPTVASVGSLPLQATNSIVVLEEFNVFKMVQGRQEFIIDIAKMVYDGKTRTTRQGANSDFLKNKPAKSALLCVGQEPFYTYDEAVNNRFVVREFPEREFDFQAFEKLRFYEKEGLGHLTTDFLKHRNLIIEELPIVLPKIQTDLKERVAGQKVLDRLVQNWAVLITPLCILIKAGKINYPLSIRQILEDAADQIKAHASKAIQQGALGEFWAFVTTKYGNGLDDRYVFHYKTDKTNQLRIRYRETYELFVAYLKSKGDRSITVPTSSNLRNKLTHPDYHAFLKESQTWMGYVRLPDGRVKNTIGSDGQPKAIMAKKHCMCFDFQALGIELSEIDYAATEQPEDPNGDLPQASAAAPVQTSLPIKLETQTAYFDPT